MTLTELIDSEPLNAGRTDQQVLDWLLESASRNLESLDGDTMFQATNSAEWVALTADDKALWMAFCARGSINPFGSANVAFVQNLFGGGSTTIATLATLRTETVTRWQLADEWELGQPALGNVNDARRP